MRVNTRSNYTSNREWFRDVLRGKNVVLSHTSALECLGQFVGYANEDQIDVYAIVREPYENINWNIVGSFDGLDIATVGGLRCTSMSQTVNDMLRDYALIDGPSLIQGLADYYYGNGESFEGLAIAPQHASRFNAIKDWAIGYYDYA
jgi:hypothetical protein